MNKQDLILEVQKLLGEDTSKAGAERALNAVIDSIMKGIKKDKEVELVGFGKFVVSKRVARKGRNPQTGEPIKIPASKVVKFKVGKKLKDSVK